MSKEKTIKRVVKFEYYQLVLVKVDEEGKQEEKLFDLIQWMDMMNNQEIKERTLGYNTDQIRVDEMYINEKEEGIDEYAILHFSRLRESNVPSITTLTKNEFKDIELQANEYIAEDVSALYDEENHILMLQRNIHSLSPTAISDYISYFWSKENEGEIVELRPVMLKNAFDKSLKKEVFRKLTVKTADMNPKESGLFSNMQGPFAEAFRSLEALDGVNIEITVSSSRKKESLNYDETIKTLKELREHNDDVQKLQISAKDHPDSKVEKMDLLNGKLTSVLEFTIPVKTSLSARSVQIRMLHEYDPSKENKKREVNSNVRKKRKE